MRRFRIFCSILRTSHAQVAQVYRFDKQGAFDGHGTAASRTFTAERLAAGATMLRDMIYTAWLDSARTTIRTQADCEGLFFRRCLHLLPLIFNELIRHSRNVVRDHAGSAFAGNLCFMAGR